jgi:ADP-glucose pyrophosphorylase
MKITNFFKEPDNNPSNLASMGIYVFKTDKLLEELNLYCEKWKLHTRSEEKPPAKFGKYGKASCSIISNGAVVNGKVSHSIISPDDFNEIDISSGNTIKSKIWETTAEENKKKIINI